MNKKIDWIVLLEFNGHKCDVCGEIEYNFIDGFCNAHTFGILITNMKVNGGLFIQSIEEHIQQKTKQKHILGKK